MAEVKWTDAQRKAIWKDKSGLLVSAAAGSGKTAVLVERVIRKVIEAGCDIDRLLVVTFTEAAALEMRERIAAALEERRLVADEGGRFSRQLTLLPGAHISTLHAFCLWVLHNYYYRLDLDPSFQVLDEAEDRLLKREVLGQVLEECYRQGDPGTPFYQLMDNYSDRGGERLRRLILRLYDFAGSQVWPEKWLADTRRAYGEALAGRLEETPWWPPVKEQARAEVEKARAELLTARRLAAQIGGPGHYLEPLDSDLSQLADLELMLKHDRSWDEIKAALSAVSFRPARRSRKADVGLEVDQKLLEQVQTLRDSAKKVIAGLRQKVFARPAAEELELIRRTEVPVAALIELVEGFAAKYAEVKKERSLVNFSDLERLCLELFRHPASTPGRLIPGETALELRAFFQEVFCDEYQDINPVQDAIFTLLTGLGDEVNGDDEVDGSEVNAGDAVDADGGEAARRRLPFFVVGDVKQSIYRFRLAEPAIFLNRSEKAENSPDWLMIHLAENFRCRRRVIEGVNDLFRAVMSREMGGVVYDERAALIYAAPYPPYPEEEPPVELFLLEGDPAHYAASGEGAEQAGEESGEELTGAADSETGMDGAGGVDGTAGGMAEMEASALEAAFVARYIKNLVARKTMIFDRRAGEHRLLTYGDIAVLLRATNVKAAQFAEVFQAEGVPLYTESGSGYFQAPEVEIMLALLAVIDNPRQDIPLAGVLRSPLVGLSAADLLAIRRSLPVGEFYEAVRKRAAVADTLGQKLHRFLLRLDRWRTQARRGSLSDLIWGIYTETAFYDYVGGWPHPEQRQANLRALYERARQFGRFSRQGLSRFLDFVADLRQNGEDLATPPALSAEGNVVRLMSIHKSKGLEFPVVIVAGLGSPFNMQDTMGAMLFERDLGLGAQYMNAARRTKTATLPNLAVKEAIRRAALSEEMRVLYVAMTRARERLVLVGTVADLEGKLHKWRQVGEIGLPGDEDGPSADRAGRPAFWAVGARSYLDWLMPVLTRKDGLVPELLATTKAAKFTGEDRQRHWRVHLLPQGLPTEGLPAGSPAAEPSAESTAEPTAEPTAKPAFPDFPMEKFRWRYPHAEAATLPVKTSVTGLKRSWLAAASGDDNPGYDLYPAYRLRLPQFLGTAGGTHAGTVTHLLLQHLPPEREYTAPELASFLAEMVARSLLTAEDARAVDQAAVLNFLKSPIGRRRQAAAQAGRRVFRELPFMVAVPARRLSLGTSTEEVFLQGVVDCIFEEPDGWVLLDFKTDRFPGLNKAAMAEAALKTYGLQLVLYRRALRQVMDCRIKESYIYLLTPGIAVPVPETLSLSPDEQADGYQQAELPM